MIKPFSQRYGHVKVEEVFQTEDLNDETRQAIWNCLYLCLFNNKELLDKPLNCARHVWIHYFYKAADEIPDYDTSYSYQPSLLATIKNYIFVCAWYNLYDLLELLINLTSNYYKFDLGRYLNFVFEKFGVSYRVVNKLVTPIVDSSEIKSIETALYENITPSKVHLSRALELLADREQPDYRNSIKESISAIEALCKKISGNDKGTLGDCLKTIEDKGHIHPAMKRAFQQLYGYTSDQGGIRHALTDESEEPTLEEARYMLVICSAFSNYLVSKMSD